MAFVDKLRRRCSEPVIVLIPVALPNRLRYRSDVVARVPVRVHVHGRAAAATSPGDARDHEMAKRWGAS